MRMVSQAESNRRWRAKNMDRVRAYGRAARERIAIEIRKLKSAPCVDCGRTYHFSVMDFDHTSGEKLLLIGKAVNQHVPLARIKAEIAKCEAVCSNCHRVRTWERQTGNTVPRERQ